MVVTAYHWDSFGATEGISITVNDTRLNPNLVATSFVNRQSVHLMFLDQEQGQCHSVALDITKKSSELMFKEKGARISHGATGNGQYVNNCLINCFSDVWFRFPVVAAITRGTLTASASRHAKRIIFVSEETHHPYASYFTDMVRLFEDQTKKPTSGQLKAIQVDVKTFRDLLKEVEHTWMIGVSCFRAGQWLADLLCLIPIHIAVTRENRFVPLRDGVTSADFERSLLGAEVGRIADSLSFGWYESILRSYMADKASIVGLCLRWKPQLMSRAAGQSCLVNG